MRELVDLGLAVANLAILAGDGLIMLGDLPVTLANPGRQSCDYFTQFLSAQT